MTLILEREGQCRTDARADMCVCVGGCKVELMDKVSRAIRQKHHNQAVSSMPPSLCYLPLFDKHRNRITIWTGPGATGKDCPTF